MRKSLPVIGLFWVMALMVACSPSVKVPEDTRSVEGTSLELSAIDSLMWRQPDSALAQLQRLVVSPEADSLDEFNGHYCQVLISELLYKNYAAQSNREELLQAVAYFDSIMQVPEPVEGPFFERNVFLAARAHYINGVGYYEKDSIVQACAEYLNALEVMEEYCEEQELVGKKAQFMAYIYNRLGDMFGEQLLAEPAITCYKQALLYSKREPTSIYGIPVLLYNLGIQYDVSRQIDSAYFYYNEALANLPDHDNIHYRDIMSTMALLDHYDFGLCSDSIIKDLKYIISISADEDERITRLLTLGNILYEDKQFDSARLYLEYVFEQQENNASKIMAAENLCSIYQIEGDSIKEHKYASFLASFTLMEIEKKTDASKVNELFKNYLIKKQEKQAEIARKKAVKKALEVSIPIAVVIALAILIMAKLRSKKLLKEQKEEVGRMLGETERQHKKELEAERQTHRMQQAALSGRLKRSNEELRELRDQRRQQTSNGLPKQETQAVSFNDEPICRLIMERVNEGQFKAKIDCELYKSYALDKQQLLDLRAAVDRHFGQFTLWLRKAYPKLTNIDIDYCCLNLLHLTYADVSALMQRAYNTVVRRDSKIQKILGSEKPISVILMDLAHNHSSV